MLDEVLTLRVWLPQPNEPSSGPYFAHPRRVALIRGILERLGGRREVAPPASPRPCQRPATPERRRSRSKGGRRIRANLSSAIADVGHRRLFPGIRHSARPGPAARGSRRRAGAARGGRQRDLHADLPEGGATGRPAIPFRQRPRPGAADAPWITIVGVVRGREGGRTRRPGPPADLSIAAPVLHALARHRRARPRRAAGRHR